MKIKQKKQVNLPQLIEWAMENDIKDTVFLTKAYSVGFDMHGFIYFNSSTTIPLDTMFTIEVEKEITEDTVIPILIERRDFGNELTYSRYEYVRIKDIKEESSTLFYIENNDKSLTLIWRDGKLVEQ